jgi:toxin ParE1/3/4
LKRVVFSPLARHDLAAIAAYIAVDNPARAYSFVLELEERCLKLTDFPNAARQYPPLGPDARILTFKRYVILYRDRPREISIERILHGARDILALIEQI